MAKHHYRRSYLLTAHPELASAVEASTRFIETGTPADLHKLLVSLTSLTPNQLELFTCEVPIYQPEELPENGMTEEMLDHFMHVRDLAVAMRSIAWLADRRALSAAAERERLALSHND